MPAEAPTPWGGSPSRAVCGRNTEQREARLQGWGGPWSRSWKGLCPRLSPQVLTLANTHQPGCRTDPCLRGWASSQVHTGPQGVQRVSARLTPTPRPRAAGAGRKLEAEPPGCLWGSRGSPQGWGGALLTGFGSIRRKRKEGAGGGQEVKGALVLLSRGFVVKNWPQTLSPGTPGQALVHHTPLSVSTSHLAAQLTPHTATPPSSLLLSAPVTPTRLSPASGPSPRHPVLSSS